MFDLFDIFSTCCQLCLENLFDFLITVSSFLKPLIAASSQCSNDLMSFLRKCPLSNHFRLIALVRDYLVHLYLLTFQHQRGSSPWWEQMFLWHRCWLPKVLNQLWSRIPPRQDLFHRLFPPWSSLILRSPPAFCRRSHYHRRGPAASPLPSPAHTDHSGLQRVRSGAGVI